MKKILIIDDNKDILFDLSEICNYKGWTPFTANSVESGIEIFKDTCIDLVIIDFVFILRIFMIQVIHSLY